MAFVQVIGFRTRKMDEVQKLRDEYVERIGPDLTARRALWCEDRDYPGRYFQLVFFDSYESAMKNSESPLTVEFAGKMSGLAEGPLEFYNLDVVEDRAMS
jgi:hypothetical protein